MSVKAGQAQGSYGSVPELRVAESVGEVEVRFTSKDAGRFEYYTRNGDCGGYPTAEDPANQSALSPDPDERDMAAPWAVHPSGARRSLREERSLADVTLGTLRSAPATRGGTQL